MSRRARRAGTARRRGNGAASAPSPPAPRERAVPTGRAAVAGDPLRTAVLGMGAVALALGLVIAGVLVLTRGGGGAGRCSPDPSGWAGAGGGGDHRGSRTTGGRAHGSTWAPAWETSAPAAGHELTAPPAYAAGTVITGDASGRVVALDVASGQARWSSDPLAAEVGPVTLTPTLDGCTAVVVTATAAGGRLRGVDLEQHGRLIGATSVGRIEGGPELVRGVAFTGLDAGTAAAPEHRVDGIALVDGGHRIQQRVAAAVVASVALSADRLYAGTLDGTLYAFQIDGSGQSLHQLWTFRTAGISGAGPVITDTDIVVAAADGTVSGLDPADGHERWRADVGGAVDVLPVLASGRVIVATRTGRVTAVDDGTGVRRWTVDGTAAVAGLAAAGTFVYVAGADGTLRVLDAGAAGVERSRWTATGPLVGQPCLTPDRVVVTSADGRVAALPL